jgi:phosphoribosylformylglycinamidine cyclo-ligase
MKRSDVIDNKNIKAGDVIVGLASYGKANYENEYNGGMGSNGLTSARHDVFDKSIAKKFPETYDAAVPENLVYSGKYKLTDKINITASLRESDSERSNLAEGKIATPSAHNDEHDITIGKLVLSPTRTYAPIIKKIIDQHRKDIHGMVHCSGGSQTKVLHFVENVHVIKDNLFPVPPLFSLIREQSGTDWKEMYKVFNMGHRMELYVPKEAADNIISISESFGVDARIVGRVESSDSNKLTIRSDKGTFEY